MDSAGRIVANRLSDSFGQQVIVENRPGAGGRIALDALAHAAPDGYTMLIAAGAPAVSGLLYASLSFDPLATFRRYRWSALIPIFSWCRNTSPICEG